MTQRKNTLQNRFMLGLASSLLLPFCLANMALANSSLQDSQTISLKAQKFQTTGKEEPKIKGDNFYTSNKVKEIKVSFKNQYGLRVAGTLFTPKNMEKGKRYQAIIVGHPMGAVKEQSSHLYATKLAEMGFVTLAIDLSFWGESAALNPQSPRNAVLPDMYVEDFLAAIDYLGTRDFIDRDKIGVLGICGSGSFSLAAAKIDSRIKAVATVSMYDMGDANRHGLNNSTTQEQRRAAIEAASNERYSEFLSGKVNKHTSGTPLTIDEGSHPVAKEFYDFYRTKRGEYTPLGAKRETTTMPTLTSNVKFLNFYPFEDLDSISTPLLFIAGDKAHSLEFSQKAYKKAGKNKELYSVKDAGHVDLYDRSEIIPFDKLEKFFKENLK